jgi:alpha-1,6-mannosyltransferase
MACGRPVVAMRAGALPEIVTPRTGVLAEPHDDPQAAAGNLAAAITELYQRDLDAAGAAARAHVLASFSVHRAMQGLMARYQAAAGTHRLPVAANGWTNAGTLN